METPETPSDVPSDGALEQPITAEDTVMHQDLENYVQSETGKMESFSNALDGNTDIHNGALGMIDADHAFAQSELHNLLIEKNVLSSPDFHERVGAFRKMFFNDKISIFNKLKDPDSDFGYKGPVLNRNITLSNIDELAKNHFPPCMKKLYNNLKLSNVIFTKILKIFFN